VAALAGGVVLLATRMDEVAHQVAARQVGRLAAQMRRA
jgi:hypothetical protein